MSDAVIERARPGGGAGIGRLEFTLLLAMSMALAALGLDLMLPAFPEIREELGLAPDSTAVSGLVTSYLLGLAIGQIAHGPLADRYGRKPTLYLGFAVYAIGALGAVVATTLPLMLMARFVWGLGGAAPRVVAIAMVRDRFEGEQMARIMSFILAVFILVPVVAPSIGAAIVAVLPVQWVFVVPAIAAVAMAFWARRLPETLRPENRLELTFARIGVAARFVVTNRQTVGYTLALTALFAVFTSYLASSEIIITEVFGLGDRFPLVFGGLAAVMGMGMLASGMLVDRVGTRRLGRVTLMGYLAAATFVGVLAVATGGMPPFWAFGVGLALVLGCHAVLIPNFNTLAMEPMATVAGTASALIGAVSTAVGSLIGAVLDQTFAGTVLPLSAAFLGFGLLAVVSARWADRGAVSRPRPTSNR